MIFLICLTTQSQREQEVGVVKISGNMTRLILGTFSHPSQQPVHICLFECFWFRCDTSFILVFMAKQFGKIPFLAPEFSKALTNSCWCSRRFDVSHEILINLKCSHKTLRTLEKWRSVFFPLISYWTHLSHLKVENRRKSWVVSILTDLTRNRIRKGIYQKIETRTQSVL